ncbi:MAG: MBL fold hydrolase [Deltaproteobacteria bacterium GWA2_54_12]|nr:MAG: MBL fold hydrolase [Deltaproteobacteria bacterium GWA2_54_12]
MEPRKITEGVFWVGAVDWDRKLFDSLIPLPDGTSYNAYLIKGSEKTALLDTVDPSKTATLLNNLKGVEKIDYIVVHHAEQDHSGSLPVVLEKYGEAKIVCNQKCKEFLIDLLHLPENRIVTVADGEVLDLGGKTLEFIFTPWVHWPETVSTFLREDGMLFSCDLFGSHLSFPGLYMEDEKKVCDASKRYYAEVMMPFRSTIKKHLERLSGFDIKTIAPSHGPLYKDPLCIMDSHRDWVSDRVSNTVLIPYATMHGSTEMMVEQLASGLYERGVKVERFNLAYADTGRITMALVDAATVVFASPTVLGGAHPLVISAAFLINALRPKLRYSAIIGSMGWGGKMAEQVSANIGNLKAENLGTILVKGMPRQDDLRKIDELAGLIASKHRESGII